MQFSFSFLFHFIFNFGAFLLFGISLCRGSWRNILRNPYGLGAALIFVGHILDAKGPLSLIGSLVVIALGLGSFVLARRNENFVPSVVREGHNILSMLVGAALFALTVQLHSVLFGVPVFQLVR
jgi:hypothetical protein